MSSNSCPCCSTSMLLHLSNRRSYWLCPHCRLEISNSVSHNGQPQSNVVGFNSSPLITAIASKKLEQPAIV